MCHKHLPVLSQTLFLFILLMSIMLCCLLHLFDGFADMIVRMLLKTLAAYVDWVPLKSLYKHNLVTLLCELLSVEQHRQAAADCLLLIVERKGPRDERVPLLEILQHLAPMVASGTTRVCVRVVWCVVVCCVLCGVCLCVVCLCLWWFVVVCAVCLSLCVWTHARLPTCRVRFQCNT